MQKAVVSTGHRARSINYFKYEMKDTNQLLKDFISCNMSDTLSRSEDKRIQNPIQEIFNESLGFQKMENSISSDYLKGLSLKNLNESEQLVKQGGKKAVKYQEELQNDQNQIFKDLINNNSLNAKRKKVDLNSMQNLILQKFYYDVSQNQDNEEDVKASIPKYKNRDLEINGNQKYQDNKQMKKQRKGLANISLRVKNIVSEHKKLTYKQVSDYVLQYSKDQIQQLQPIQRSKEVKNIKRRVYDALNVLVAVGILGKHQRCVCITEWTNIPGKRHSTQWQKINNKIQYMNKLKRNCAQKSQVLKFLFDKYNAITALKNKHNQEQHLQYADMQPRKAEKYSFDQNMKLMFPLIVFLPALEENSNQKLTVQLENDDSQSDQTQKNRPRKEKVKISGKNITILGDTDCVLEMDLERYRNIEEQTKLIEEIQEYANQCANKRAPDYKQETDDFGQASIQDYFDDQMFQSK